MALGARLGGLEGGSSSTAESLMGDPLDIDPDGSDGGDGDNKGDTTPQKHFQPEESMHFNSNKHNISV